MANTTPASLFSALRAREEGFNFHRPDDHILGALRTTPEDEFSFWNCEPPFAPQAVPPFSIAFSTYALRGHALLAADEAGVITILDTRRSFRAQLHALTNSPEAPVTRFRAHENAIFDAIWMNDDMDVVTASGDTTVRVFDVERNLRKANCREGTGSIKAVRNLTNSPYVLGSVSRDGGVRVFDTRTPTFSNIDDLESYHSSIFAVEDAHAKPATTRAPGRKRRRRVDRDVGVNSVTALATVPGKPHFFFTAGAADGTVKLWDLRKFGRTDEDPVLLSACPGDQLRLDCEPRRRQYGLASLDVNMAGTHLIASGTDSTIYMYDIANMDRGYTNVLGGHKQTSFYIRAKFSPCGRFVGSGSMDSKVYIWDTWEGGELGRLDPILLLDGHRGGDAAGVDWCKAQEHKLVSYSDDSTARVWKVHAGCSAGGVKRGDEVPSMSARRVEVKRRTLPRRRWHAKRQLKDSDIRSYFKVGSSSRATSQPKDEGAQSVDETVLQRVGNKRVFPDGPGRREV